MRRNLPRLIENLENTIHSYVRSYVFRRSSKCTGSKFTCRIYHPAKCIMGCKVLITGIVYAQLPASILSEVV